MAIEKTEALRSLIERVRGTSLTGDKDRSAYLLAVNAAELLDEVEQWRAAYGDGAAANATAIIAERDRLRAAVTNANAILAEAPRRFVSNGDAAKVGQFVDNLRTVLAQTGER